MIYLPCYNYEGHYQAPKLGNLAGTNNWETIRAKVDHTFVCATPE